ncbi:DUF6084 family protein [soil metagenome]|jgi:hypothetical protein|nr:hypothetical protein [Chloroflexota bacterium]
MSDLTFAVVGARAEPYAVAPTLMLRLAVAERSGEPIQAIALRTQIMIEPRRRHYTAAEESRLLELFGEPQRWGDTLQTMLWTHSSLVVPAFQERVEVDLPLACTYDFEVASSKFFHALEDGGIPLLLLFSGTVFARGPGGLRIDQVPWHEEASYLLPVSVWRDLMNQYFPGSAWIRMRSETFDALHAFRGQNALPSWDQTIEELLQRAGERRLA